MVTKWIISIIVFSIVKAEKVLEKANIYTIPLPSPIYPSEGTISATSSSIIATTSPLSLSTTATTTTTTTSTPSTTISTSSLTTNNSTLASGITPSGQCNIPNTQFLCYNASSYARCISGQWSIQSCPGDTHCASVGCIWGAPPVSSSSSTQSTTSIRSTTLTKPTTSFGQSSTTTSSATMTPGGSCNVPDSNFVCYDDTNYARCVFNSWLVQSCPPGTVCVGGLCGWGKKLHVRKLGQV